jgi:O-methyltransferase
MTDAPAQDHKIIRKIIPGFMQPLLRGLRKRIFSLDRPKEEPYRTVFPYTQAHLARQKSLLYFASDIDARNVPGVIVECGVLDGGTAALMAFGSSKSERKIHLFDSWRGLLLLHHPSTLHRLIFPIAEILFGAN